jgi:glycosyltransferase involved in cell wall biosynthesis
VKIAIVCDFLTKFGGAERVLLALHKIYPDAPIHCLLYDETGTKGKFKECNIIQSSLKNSPWFLKKRIKFLLPKLPRVIEEFDLSGYDLVVSSSNSFAHGVITKPTTCHISYCHSPMRYAWDWYNEYLAENNIGYGLKGLIVRKVLHNIRIWDKVSADRVDYWIANSENSKNRISKYYQKDATVIYPPVDVEKIEFSSNQGDYYLIVSRLEPYKKIKLAVEAFNKSGKELYIIGEGSEYAELKEIAKDNIKLLGWQSDESMHNYLKNARAFIFPGEEDFGITPVEAMAAGKPVIAFDKGGVKESVIENETGIFFKEENADSLAEAIIKFEKMTFDPQQCRERAEHFSEKNFKENFKKFVETKVAEYKKEYEL